MADSLSVFTALPWTDQDHQLGWQWTVGDKFYIFIQLLIGICFGLTQPCLERIISHLLGWVCYCIGQGFSQPSPGRSREDPERTALLREGQNPRSCSYLPIDSVNCDRHSVRDWTAKVTSLLIVVFGIAYIAAGTFVTTIPTDQAALSGSTKCGVWGLIGKAQGEAQNKDALIQGQKETRAGQYARDCYGPQPAASLGQCSIFTRPYVPAFREEKKLECPFLNESYCAGDGFTAAKFTTDLADAALIGINARNSPKFNRTTICVPLNLRQGFVERTSSQIGHWAYNLGPVQSELFSSNYTFQQFGDPFDTDVRSYTMSTYTHVYSKAPWDNYWLPISGLNIRPELSSKSRPYSITIMFINSCRIFYRKGSIDPIFPADKPWPRDPSLFTNNDSKARPLVCIDWLEVCTNDGKHCFPPYENLQNNDTDFIFTQYALNKSTIFHGIEFQGANGLRAQEKIKDDTSLPLDEHPMQWVVESWALFNASLSRIQYDALDIANGTGWDKEPMYDQKMPEWAQGKVCGIYKFQLPKGFGNIRIWPTFLVLLVPLALVLMGTETKIEFDEENKRSGYFPDHKLMGIEWLFWRLKTYGSRTKPTGVAPRAADAQVQAGGSNQQAGGLTRNYGSTVPTPQQPRPQTDHDNQAQTTPKPSQSSRQLGPSSRQPRQRVDMVGKAGVRNRRNSN